MAQKSLVKTIVVCSKLDCTLGNTNEDSNTRKTLEAGTDGVEDEEVLLDLVVAYSS